MTDKFLNTIYKYSMFSPGEKVVVGLSGGADSMCLINLLCKYSKIFDIQIEAAHINHCIRGDEADSDENFVRKFCAEAGIKLYVLKVDVPAVSRKTGESTELAARKIRYEYFLKLGADKIATAHTGSDSIETMFINLSRGASLHGLASIPAVRGNIVRPLIGCTRAEIQKYCEDNFIDYVTDSTNLCDEYTRNKFRHKVLPRFAEINPDFENVALRCIDFLRRDDDYLNSVALKIIGSNTLDDGSLSTLGLSILHKSILSRVISIFLSERFSAEYEAKHIEMLAENIDKKFSVVLPGNMKFSCDGSRLFYEPKSSLREVPQEINFDKKNPVVFTYCNKKYQVYPAKNLPDNTADLSAIADYNKLDDTITVRSRYAGDSFTSPKRGCTKSLKKLFNEMKIPVAKRNSTAVFSDKNGIIYIEDVGTDLSRLPDKSTEKFLIIKKEYDKNE